jgi:V/A-type H+-transporting ATPase subunit C
MQYELNVLKTKLVMAENLPAFIEQMTDTALQRLLKNTYEKHPTLFALEQQLDLYYYIHLWKTKNNLPNKKNRRVLERVKGTEIDLRNILWMYRLKKYYNLHGASLYVHLIPICHRLNRADIRRMAESAGMEAFIQEAASGPYKNVFTAEGAVYTLPDRDIKRALASLHTREAKQNPDTLAVVIAYLFDKEREINNITAITEGIRYGRQPEEIQEYLY